MIVFGNEMCCLHILQFQMDLLISLCISFQKKFLLIKEFVLFVPTCHCRLCEVTKMVKVKGLGAARAFIDLSVS